MQITDLTSGVNANEEKNELALNVLEGLSTRPKGLPSRLFYDDKGSKLFTKIMKLDEYYPTRCETEILTKYSPMIAQHLQNQEFNIIELGCGDGTKTTILLDSLIKEETKIKFVPLDISKAAISFLHSNLLKKYKTIPFEVNGLVAEYFQGLSWLSENASSKNLILFLGSNIGNLNKPMALRFLRHLWYSLNDGDLVLIGFDLKKDLDTLYNAYNDKEGVTKEFNFNVLDRINSLLGGNFDRNKFQHQGLYNVQTGAMESYLISQEAHWVKLAELDKEFHFNPWEAIHMEYSYKYLETDITDLAKSTGFNILDNYTDKDNFFIDSLWEVRK